MFVERTTVGLDVHSRSVVAEAVDWARDLALLSDTFAAALAALAPPP